MVELNEGKRKHKLMPSELKSKIPKLYSQDGNKNPTVYAKFFSPYSSYTLWITEFDGEDTLYGYVTGMQVDEWGYASLNELASSDRNGLPLIERDTGFKPKKFKSIKFGSD
jgi:hypothetical protein